MEHLKVFRHSLDIKYSFPGSLLHLRSPTRYDTGKSTPWNKQESGWGSYRIEYCRDVYLGSMKMSEGIANMPNRHHRTRGGLLIDWVAIGGMLWPYHKIQIDGSLTSYFMEIPSSRIQDFYILKIMLFFIVKFFF